MDNTLQVKTTGAREPFWIDDAAQLRFPKLGKDTKADVAIIGAGITGITTAYLLSGSGKKIVLIDDGLPGSGETGRTTAHLTHVVDPKYSEIAGIHGEHNAFLVYDSHKNAIALIESISKNEEIDCDFQRVDGYLFLHPTDHRDSLENEMEICKDIGIFVELEDRACLPFNTGVSLRFPQQAQFHPLKYLNGLAKVARKNGVEIYAQTKADKVTARGVRTESGHSISAKHIVIATHAPVKGGQIFGKEVQYRSYVIGANVPKNSVEPCLYWDTGDQSRKSAYHYIRVHRGRGHDVLMIGGEDHPTGHGNEKAAFSSLEKWARRHFPMIASIDYKWSGQIIESSDGLAFIGRSPWHDFNLYIATGYSGNGMTYGTIAAMIISDLIEGRENKWADLYDPKRIKLMAIPQMIHDNLGPIKQMAAGWIKGGNIESLEEIGAGKGGVMDRVAVYRDEQGKIHAHSAVCPHMGCITSWNSTEKTFDCPCHGSRFTSMGKMINGPAISGLEPVEIPKETERDVIHVTKDKIEKLVRKTKR